MPTYDFKCMNCDWEITRVLTIDEYKKFMTNPRMKECPNCYKESVIRNYTPVEFRFEGGKPSERRD